MLNLETEKAIMDELEYELSFLEADLEEQQNEAALFRYDFIRSMSAAILFVLFFAAVVLLFVLPVTRPYMIKLLGISFANYPHFEVFDVALSAGTYLVIVAIGAWFVSWGTDEMYPFALLLTLFPPIGLVNLVNVMFLSSAGRKKLQQKQETTAQMIASMRERIAQDPDRQPVQTKQSEQKNAEYCYQKAHATEQVDQQLLETAAQIGHPAATVEHVEQLLVKVNSSLYSQSEKEALRRQANDYLEQTDFTDCPDGEILWILTHLDSMKNEDKGALLDKARKAKQTGKLSARYAQLADRIIQRLVKELDEAQANA